MYAKTGPSGWHTHAQWASFVGSDNSSYLHDRHVEDSG